eukprot:3503665-Alexandrium_andersonii.AAC.1
MAGGQAAGRRPTRRAETRQGSQRRGKTEKEDSEDRGDRGQTMNEADGRPNMQCLTVPTPSDAI